MNPTGDMCYILGVFPFSTTQGFSKCMHSILIRPYCTVCESHFATRGQHSQSYFLISYTNSPYACVGLIEQREISTPRVISLYHIMTPHKNVWGASYNVKWALSELFHHNMISVSSMSPFSMAHGRHYAIKDRSFWGHAVIRYIYHVGRILQLEMFHRDASAMSYNILQMHSSTADKVIHRKLYVWLHYAFVWCVMESFGNVG